MNVDGSRTEKFETAMNKVILHMPQLLTGMHSIQKEAKVLETTKAELFIKRILPKELSFTN